MKKIIHNRDEKQQIRRMGDGEHANEGIREGKRKRVCE